MTTSPGRLTLARRPVPMDDGRMLMGSGRVLAGPSPDDDVSGADADGFWADDDEVHLR
ncbi:hypothetical protein [Sorangium sp. So ce693]|uniref:hypothetical protein n=1 Tax=Sorangium sp. So ce693 TaxID=3133318 RepID=UPI003F611D6F